MFILKLAIELTILVVLFLMIRKALYRSFPILNDSGKKVGNSRKWRVQRFLYSFIFLVFGFISTISTFWIIYFAFSILHSVGNFSGVLVISQVSLMLPSLIIGFYISTLGSRNLYLQLVGTSDMIMEEIEGPKRAGTGITFKRVFSFLTITPAVILLFLQFNVYLKTDGQNIYTKQLLQAERVYSITDVVRVGANESNYLDIYMENGEKISTIGYSGNLNYFLDNITRK